MFLAIVKIFPRPESEQCLLELLGSMKGPLSGISDCLGCSIAIEENNGKEICYTEQWKSREALEIHLRSALYARLLEALEISKIAPEVGFYEMTGVGGLELIEDLRTNHPQ